MALEDRHEVFVFDQDSNKWHAYWPSLRRFVAWDGIPRLTKNFAGIGTRDISEEGIKAIRDMYDYNLEIYKKKIV